MNEDGWCLEACRCQRMSVCEMIEQDELKREVLDVNGGE